MAITSLISRMDRNEGLAAIKLLNKLESETTYTWTKAKTTQFAEGKKVTLKKLVKPGWKWVVSQLIGTVSFLEISTDEYKSTYVQYHFTIQEAS